MRKCKECERCLAGNGLFCPHCGARDWDVQEFGVVIAPPENTPTQPGCEAKCRMSIQFQSALRKHTKVAATLPRTASTKR